MYVHLAKIALMLMGLSILLLDARVACLVLVVFVSEPVVPIEL